KPEYVILEKFIDGIFYVSICCEQNGEKIFFDSRCSDAFNLSVRLSLPIFVEEKVLDNVGFEIVSPNLLCNQSESEAEWTIEELQLLLKEVEEQGEKEIADLLREKIKDLENEN
ncbi:MAG: bifunctional nuclease domain-containing protein, partial [Bacteroidales bacterium]|nr:bifunctional nuclease domain-containing protein [Bacteroidales bacterium]